MKSQNNLLKMVLAALFLALAYVMPFLTGQIPEIGSMLCPLHIPVLLCGFICGWPWGLAVGFIAPLFRSLTLGMPPFFLLLFVWHLNLPHMAELQDGCIRCSRTKNHSFIAHY